MKTPVLAFPILSTNMTDYKDDVRYSHFILTTWKQNLSVSETKHETNSQWGFSSTLFERDGLIVITIQISTAVARTCLDATRRP